MTQPKISVVTPCFNAALYIEKCILSVANQTFREVEHIIIDDASDDQSRDIVQRLAKTHVGITLLPLEENLGQARARNRGIDAARGDFVLFLDSDDMLDSPDALERLWAQTQAQTDLLHFQYRRYVEGSDDIRPASNALTGISHQNVNVHTFPQILNNTSCWQMMYRREFLNEKNIRFSNRLRQREDRPFFTECILNAERIDLCQVSVVRYQIRRGSTMRTLNPAQLDMYATHVEIVGRMMSQAVDAGLPLHIYAANAVYYMDVLISYWRPFLLQDEIWATPQCARFIAAWQEWRYAPMLAKDEVMKISGDEMRKRGHYDALFFLLRRAHRPLLHRLLRDGSLQVSDLAQLHRLLDSADHPVLRFISLARPIPKREVDELPESLRILLHVGSTKTGSSALQKFFELNRFELLARHGVYYPYCGIENGTGSRSHRTSGHATLIENILHGRTGWKSELASELAVLPTHPSVIVISAENILSDRFWLNGQVVEKLASGFAGHHCTVLAYLRHPISWLESMYIESVGSPGRRYTGTIEQFSAEQEAMGLLDFAGIRDRFSSAFPEERILLRSYEHSHTCGGTIDDALAVLGIKDDGFAAPSDEDRNPSLPSSAVALLRSANTLTLSRETAAKLAAETRLLTAGLPKKRLMRRELAADLDARLTAPNAKVFETQPSAYATILEGPFAESDDIPSRLLIAFMPLVEKALTVHVDAERLESPEIRDIEMENQLLDYLKTQATSARIDAAKQILDSGLFDFTFYLQQFPSTATSKGGPILHFVDHWQDLMPDPCPGFSTRDYLQFNGDVAAAGINPFLHYLNYGKAEGRPLHGR